MMYMHPLIFTAVILASLVVGWVFGWKSGHVSGHWCERDNADEQRFWRGDDNE